jgi:hypothetical protein
MRFVGRRLVLRLQRELTDDELADLGRDFGDIVTSGGFQRVRRRRRSWRTTTSPTSPGWRSASTGRATTACASSSTGLNGRLPR